MEFGDSDDQDDDYVPTAFSLGVGLDDEDGSSSEESTNEEADAILISHKRARSESEDEEDPFSSDNELSEEEEEEDNEEQGVKFNGSRAWGPPPLTSAPATIAFNDAKLQPKPMVPSPDFHSESFGSLATLYHSEAWNVRLLGRLTLRFEFPEATSKQTQNK